MSRKPGISIKNLLATSRLLSLDVVLGSLASCILAEHVLGVNMPLAWWLVIALAVWAIYTADHLLDASRSPGKLKQARHLFHDKYRQILSISAVLAGILSVSFALLFLSREIITMGIVLGLATSLYLYLLMKGILPGLVFHKEIIVAMLYTFGIWGAPLITAWPPPDMHVMALLTAFLFNAYLNLLILSWYESKADQHSNQLSLDHLTGHGFLNRYIPVVSIPALLLPVVVIVAQPHLWYSAGILIIMTIAHLLIFTQKKQMQRDSIYRPAAEAVFFLPFLQVFKQ